MTCLIKVNHIDILSIFRNICQNGYNRLGIEKCLIDFFNATKDKINIKFEICSEEELSKASTLKNNNSWIAIVKQKNDKLDNYIFNETTLVLDDIKDPWNLWTIIRIADWYWIKNIVCSNDTCEFYNPKVIISTMWSFSRVNIKYTNLKDFLSLQKMPIYWAFLWWECFWGRYIVVFK